MQTVAEVLENLGISGSFPLGAFVTTPNAIATHRVAGVFKCLTKHAQKDWGDTVPHDAQINDKSVEDGWGDILSVYNLPTGKLLIKTEADGSVTTAFNSDES